MYPPILAIVLNLVLADFEGVVLIRKIVHLDDHLFSAAVERVSRLVDVQL